jgi:hypothetical protein
MIHLNDHNEIWIDKEGIWYFRGAEMKRKDIVQYFYRYLKRDHKGNYLIEVEDDRCKVRVEDTPYVVRSIAVGFPKNSDQPYIDLSLNDGSSEGLNLDTPLRIGKDNVLYCMVKKGEYEARFSRPAYYQFCKYIDYDSRREKYQLTLNHLSYPVVFTGVPPARPAQWDGELYKPNINGGSNVR